MPVFLCACRPREPTQAGPDLRSLSPPTGPMPGTSTEREVDDTARKSHKEPVTFSVQLQPYDPPCCLGCPLSTAPRVRPEGVRDGAGEAPFSLGELKNRRGGGIQATEYNSQGYSAPTQCPASRQGPLSSPQLPILESPPHPHIPIYHFTSHPCSAGGLLDKELTGRGCRHRSLPTEWAQGPQIAPMGAAPSALSHRWSQGTGLWYYCRDQPCHPQLPGSVGPWRDRPQVRTT